MIATTIFQFFLYAIKNAATGDPNYFVLLILNLLGVDKGALA